MEHIAVYGAGTIGSGQATLIIGHGLPCLLVGRSQAGLERCRSASSVCRPCSSLSGSIRTAAFPWAR